MSGFTGFENVTPAKLQIKDRTTIPPDRVVFSYHVCVEGKDTVVEGGWGDYLRDREKGLVNLKHAPLCNNNNPEHAMLITDLYVGIPDRAFILDPTIPL